MSIYTFSERASEDIDEILAFTIERWGTTQAEKYLRTFEALFHMIAGRPMMGRSAARVKPNLRRVEHESHIVFYTTVPLGIRIERILHKSKALKKSNFVS